MEKLKYSPRHEQIVLGTMLKDRSVRRRLSTSLSASEFHVTRHKVIFSGLVSLVQGNLDYTPATLTTLLPESDWGGKEYLDKLEKMGNSKNIDHHVIEMRWDIARIQAFEDLVPELVAELKDPRADKDDVLKLSSSIQNKLANSRIELVYEGGEGLSSQYAASLLARRVGSTFRSSGFKAMDKNLVYGFAPGKMSIIAGATSAGKSTLAINLGLRQSKLYKVGYLAWEMSINDMLDSFCASGLKIPLEKLIKFTKMLTREEQSAIDDFVANLLGHDQISFLQEPPDDKSKGAPWDVNERIVDWTLSKIDDWGRDIVYWDLFESRFATTSPDHILLALKRIYHAIKPNKINTHMCLLHQLQLKELERRQDKRPTRDVLKGTGGYLEVPDVVLTVYRPALYQPGLDDNVIDIECHKQRQGPSPWRMIAEWQGPYVRILKMREGKPIIVKQDPATKYRNRI